METQITDTTIVFFGFSVVTSFLAMIIIAISVAYYKLSRSAHGEREAFLKRQEQAKMTESQIIAEARKKSQEILASAQVQAQQLLQASDMFSKEYKDEFRAKLLKVLSSEEQSFKNMYQEIKNENSRVISSMSKGVTDSLTGELNQFKSSIQNQIKNILVEYRNAAYLRIEQDVSELVATISRRVLRKSISQEEHTQLVLQALEEAKKNKVI